MNIELYFKPNLLQLCILLSADTNMLDLLKMCTKKASVLFSDALNDSGQDDFYIGN